MMLRALLEWRYERVRWRRWRRRKRRRRAAAAF
jgi:hypothetical protein